MNSGTMKMKEQLPIRIVSRVVRGFGRGSKDLGIPTANVSREEGVYSCSSSGGFDALPTGIYWGFARICDDGDVSVDGVLGRVHKAAISVGFNPTYNNKQKTVEPHLIEEYGHPQRHASSTKETLFQDFYDRQIVLSLVGYLRPEVRVNCKSGAMSCLHHFDLSTDDSPHFVHSCRLRAWRSSLLPLRKILKMQNGTQKELMQQLWASVSG